MIPKLNPGTQKGQRIKYTALITQICRLQAFRAAGSGERVTSSSASLQRAEALLREPIRNRAPSSAELPTGACWPLISLVRSNLVCPI